jgi:putative ABC transport system ATP-binding protein
MASTPQLQVRDLVRVYGRGAAAVRAVDGLDLELGQGEFLAVTGVSGSGKSTFLHLAGALDTPTSGSIRFSGRELGGLSSYERALYRRQSIGFVFQAFHLAAHVFAFPFKLMGGAVLFALLVSLTAGVYPAMRAARIDPIRALRAD